MQRNVKIIYSKRLEEKYSTNHVERPERVVLPALDLISDGYEFIEPFPASLQEISQVHGKEHIEQVKKKGFFEAASLAAGGAICAAELACRAMPPLRSSGRSGTTLLPIGLGGCATSITWLLP
jgi:acetoin utilization deacetylase AcuC-like enzyme